MTFTELAYAFVSFPTIVFSVPLAVFAIYWTFAAFVGGLDFDIDADFDIDTDIDLGHKLMFSMGLSKVPSTVGFSFVALYGTAISMIFHFYILSIFFNFSSDFNYWSWYYIFVSVVADIFILFAAMYLAGLTVKPMIPLFCDDDVRLIQTYEGKIAHVTSKKVNKDFGEVSFKEDGSEYVLDAYSEEEIARGEEVLIVSKNSETGNYLVQKI